MDDYLKKLQEYSQVYKREILPTFRIFEPSRAKLHKKKMLIQLLAIIVIPFLFIFPFFMANSNINKFLPFMFFIIMFAILAFVCMYSSVEKEIKDFKILLKKHCLNKILKIFPNIERIPNAKINTIELAASEIFKIPNTIICDDKFVGVHNEVPFSIIEYTAIYGSGKHQYSERNVLFITQSNKKVGATTVFQTKGIFYAKIVSFFVAILVMIFVIAGVIFSKKINADSISLLINTIVGLFVLGSGILASLKGKINLEDIQSQKEFFVHSKDQIEARYLLTPAFIERFKTLKKMLKVKNLEFSFYDNDKFMLKIEAKKDLFEMCDINKSLLNTDCMESLFKELKVIYDIIDCLKFDENISL